VLAVAGPSFEQRQELFDFVLLELLARQPLCEHRLKPVCSLLSGQKADLLAFVEQVDVDIASLAATRALDYLNAPVRLVTAPHTPVPFSPALENFYVPKPDRVAEAARSTVKLAAGV